MTPNEEHKMGVQFTMMAPFGPRIAKIRCPDEITSKLLELTDEILANQDRQSWGENLVGQIKDEPYISKEMLGNIGALGFFNGCVNHYVTSVCQDIYGYTGDKYLIETGLQDVWAVNQLSGEYNPLHFHTFCHISSVMYLKIPDYTKRNLPHKQDRDGYIEFAYHADWPDSLQRGTILQEPEVGVLYLWPANLLHTVYPFIGEGVRRSVAFNAVYKVADKSTGKIVAGRE